MYLLHTYLNKVVSQLNMTASTTWIAMGYWKTFWSHAFRKGGVRYEVGISSSRSFAAMRPGAPIPGLDKIYPAPKDGSSASRVPVALRRDEYPPWVNDLTRPLPSLAKLRSMKVEDATDRDMKRYLKLVRKAKIKWDNESRAKS
jgi:hypothetical protein